MLPVQEGFLDLEWPDALTHQPQASVVTVQQALDTYSRRVPEGSPHCVLDVKHMSQRQKVCLQTPTQTHRCARGTAGDRLTL